ncbi:Transposon Tf2-8 polyprotein [Trichinella nelsoni]|uniref:Transposon Tf2-8 polyprotein n=1 Tax=Trichinella nelsoni TaxID=6336 RepID=A0A0V0S068_9BILA|nr:Transposon Tf2-8 polyprotein [Trichinella nelsoni]
MDIVVEYKMRKQVLPLMVIKGRGPSSICRNWFDALNIKVASVNMLTKNLAGALMEDFWMSSVKEWASIQVDHYKDTIVYLDDMLIAEKNEAYHWNKTPENRKDLEVFLVMLDFYEQFLPNKSAVLEPLFQLLKKEVPWKLKGKHAKSFEVAKKLLMSHNVLTRYSIDLPLILAGVALDICVTAVLAHKLSDEIKAMIAYGSRILQKSEKTTHS